MNPRRFLSVSLKSWVLSLFFHLAAGTALLYAGRARGLDLTALDLDFAPTASPRAAGSAQPVEEDNWRKPYSAPPPKTKPVPPPPAVAPAPPNSAPDPAPAKTGDGTGFLSMAQVNQGPQFKIKVKPAYPEAAKRANIEGVVILQVDIDATGAVKKVAIVQGLGYGCDEAAVEALKQSTLSPAFGPNGEPEPVHFQVTYRFQLEQR